jgi:hypothetical protein
MMITDLFERMRAALLLASRSTEPAKLVAQLGPPRKERVRLRFATNLPHFRISGLQSAARHLRMPRRSDEYGQALLQIRDQIIRIFDPDR